MSRKNKPGYKRREARRLGQPPPPPEGAREWAQYFWQQPNAEEIWQARPQGQAPLEAFYLHFQVPSAAAFGSMLDMRREKGRKL